MSVQLTCKQCGKQVRAADKYAGWRVECPQCKTMNQFPAKAEPLPEGSEIPDRREPVAEASQGPARSEQLPRASEIPARKEPVQPASPLPQVCSLCGKGFTSQSQQVRDPQGKLFHRACHELEQRRLQGLKRCALCDRPATVEEMVQDPTGKAYHRRCYDRERARRLAQAARQKSAPSVAPLSKPLPPEPIEPEILEPEIVEPEILEPEIVDVGAPAALPGTAPAALVPQDDLWNELNSPMSGGGDDAGMMGDFGQPFYYERAEPMSTGMYVLIGVGAAMPVLVLLAILVYSFTRPTSAPPAASGTQMSTEGNAPADGPPTAPQGSLPSTSAPAPSGPPNVAPGQQSSDAAAAASSPAPANLPAWQPDTAMVEQLGPYEDVDAYQVRPPKGYQSIASPPPPPGAKAFAWAGSPRPDGTRPMVMVMLLTPPPQDAARMTVQKLFDKMVAGLRQRRTTWQQSPPEWGQINGLTFLRTVWQGASAEAPAKMHGCEYTGRDGATFIQMRTQDVEPHQDQALKLATACLLTFRKK